MQLNAFEQLMEEDGEERKVGGRREGGDKEGEGEGRGGEVVTEAEGKRTWRG